MSDSLQLSQLLNKRWLEKLGPIIEKQPQVETYIGVNRQKTFPKREQTFRALNEMEPEDCKVVIFGQDPYPRETSACGVAFYDGLQLHYNLILLAEIKNWKDKMSPSFRNIIKNVLISEGKVDKSAKVAELRKKIQEMKLAQPPEWFESTMKQGCLWLNTALTFTGKAASELARHTAFWRPILKAVIEILLDVQVEKKKQGKTAGLIFVFWGDKAKKLKSIIDTANKKRKVDVRFVEAHHPAVESFHNTATFSEITKQLKELGYTPINWIPKEKENPLKRKNAENGDKKAPKKRKKE